MRIASSFGTHRTKVSDDFGTFHQQLLYLNLGILYVSCGYIVYDCLVADVDSHFRYPTQEQPEFGEASHIQNGSAAVGLHWLQENYVVEFPGDVWTVCYFVLMHRWFARPHFTLLLLNGLCDQLWLVRLPRL